MNLDLKSIDKDLQGAENAKSVLAPPKDTLPIISPEDDIAIANSINQVHKELNMESKSISVVMIIVVLLASMGLYILNKNKILPLPWKA